MSSPEVGWYAFRLVRGGPDVAAMISCTAEGMWSATVDGELQMPVASDPAVAEGVSRIWESARRITEDQYRYMLALAEWARRYQPQHPSARPREPIALTRSEPLF